MQPEAHLCLGDCAGLQLTCYQGKKTCLELLIRGRHCSGESDPMPNRVKPDLPEHSFIGQAKDAAAKMPIG